MKLKARDKESLNAMLEKILNMACVICMGGYIPTEWDIENKERSGRLWIRKDNFVDLYPLVNNYWATIEDETDTSLSLSFRCRYDKESLFEKNLSEMCLRVFPYNIEK